MKNKFKFHKSHLEAYFWLTSLIYMALSNPYSNNHFSLCLFKNSGIEDCSGCGIGHSISLLFKADITGSFEQHPLGIFAVIILIFRIYKIFKSHPLITKI